MLLPGTANMQRGGWICELIPDKTQQGKQPRSQHHEKPLQSPKLVHSQGSSTVTLANT